MQLLREKITKKFVNLEHVICARCRLQTADCRLQTGYKMQTRYKMQTADCRLGIKCRLRPILGINCRLSERNVFNVPQCHAIAFPSVSAAKSFFLGAKRQHWIGRLYYFLIQKNITCLFASAIRKNKLLTCRNWTRCKLISDTAELDPLCTWWTSSRWRSMCLR